MTDKLTGKRTLPLALVALGVVFGDIGTSPLYALRESLVGLPVTAVNVLGVLSLIFWSLILVVSVKYICYILRADNDGEGGVLALLALIKRKKQYRFFILLGVIGAGLLLGDSMITPAISVMSAIEGLQQVSPAFEIFIVPLAVIILLALFLFQHLGTEKIGRYFGPMLLLWFIVLAILGVVKIIPNPKVLAAINPYYAFAFFVRNGWKAYELLGGIFLVVTGGEALYADLGHFGKAPIRLGWFALVLPALLLNYFGQGACLLETPSFIRNPFYLIAPSWFFYPLLVIATIATIIASQSVISATFSLTKQAILLDLCPRLPIIQTSAAERGQIYLPQMNALLAIGTILLVFSFQSSSALAHAYGVAVNLVMLTVTIMVVYIARAYWRWSLVKIMAIFSFFILIDLFFLGANLQKFATGGWVPLSLAALCAIIMLTWQHGMRFLRASYQRMEDADLKSISEQLRQDELAYLKDQTIIFINDPYNGRGSGLLHYFRLSHMIAQYVLVISIEIHSHPYISQQKRFKLIPVGKGIYHLKLQYGFMQLIDIPKALLLAQQQEILPFAVEVERVSFLVEMSYISVIRQQKSFLRFCQEKLFAFLFRNAGLDVGFYGLPFDRTIAVGAYCEL